MSDMPIINVDVDGVLYDFTEAMRKEIVLQMGLPLDSLPDPQEWSLQNVWPVTWAQLRSVMHDGIAQGRVFRSGQMLEDVWTRRSLQHMIDLGWHVRLVTSKTFDDDFITMQARKNMLDWVHTNEIPHHTISFTDESGKLSYRADAVIDDKPTLSWVQWGAENFLYDQPWNQTINVEEHQITRVKTLFEVYETLKGEPSCQRTQK